MKSGRMLSAWTIATRIQNITRSFVPSSNAALCAIPRANGKSDAFAGPLLEPKGAGPRWSPATASSGADSIRLGSEVRVDGECTEATYNDTYSTDRSRFGPFGITTRPESVTKK